MRKIVFAASMAAVLWSTEAVAYLMIMPGDTDHVSCVSGICRANARKACISVADLEIMLAEGDVTLISGATAKDIQVNAGFTWKNGNRLTLDSFHSVNIKHPIVVEGGGGLTLTTNDGGHNGKFLFTGAGAVHFRNPASSLVINGRAYHLVSSLRGLAYAIRKQPDGYFALAGSYNAARDRFRTVPINTPFFGTFEGLGNTLSHLNLSHYEKLVIGNARFDVAGLFGFVAQPATVRDLHLQNGVLKGSNAKAFIGLAAGRNEGLLRYVSVDGTISGTAAAMGGIVGWNDGTIYGANAGANLSATRATSVGGVAGESLGTIEMSRATGSAIGGHYTGGLAGQAGAIRMSFATGAVSGGEASTLGGVAGRAKEIEQSFATGMVTGLGPWVRAGGLVGRGSDIRDSFAIGRVTAPEDSVLGGLAGTVADGAVERSYAAGSVSGQARSLIGGLLGRAERQHVRSGYWDTKMSGQSQACGRGRCRGATGMSSKKFKARLPAGFGTGKWGEDAAMNGGYPYLLAPLKRFP